jgi:hypothetical protein
MARCKQPVDEVEPSAGSAEALSLELGAGPDQGAADPAQRRSFAPKVASRTRVVEERDQSRRALVQRALASRDRVAYGEVGGLGLESRVEKKRLVRRQGIERW